jgi:hypothetical protein
MDNIVARNVDDLSAPNRQHLEQILGRELAPHQKVYIIVGLLHPKPSAAAKRKAASSIRQIFANAKPQKKVTARVADRMVKRAVADVRRS